MIRSGVQQIAARGAEVLVGAAVVIVLALGVVKGLERSGFDPVEDDGGPQRSGQAVLVTKEELLALGGGVRPPTWGAIQRFYFLGNDQIERSMEITLERDNVDFETVLSQAPTGDVWIATDRDALPRP